MNEPTVRKRCFGMFWVMEGLNRREFLDVVYGVPGFLTVGRVFSARAGDGHGHDPTGCIQHECCEASSPNRMGGL